VATSIERVSSMTPNYVPEKLYFLSRMCAAVKRTNFSVSYIPCYIPCAASLAGIPPGGLGLSGLVYEKADPSISKSV